MKRLITYAAVCMTVMIFVTQALATTQHQQSPVEIIRHQFGSTAHIAECFAYRESHFEPHATHYNTNGTIDRGLFQINSSWIGHRVQYYALGHGVNIVIGIDRHGRVEPALLYKARYNARIAWAISQAGTYWKAWNWNC